MFEFLNKKKLSQENYAEIEHHEEEEKLVQYPEHMIEIENILRREWCNNEFPATLTVQILFAKSEQTYITKINTHFVASRICGSFLC